VLTTLRSYELYDECPHAVLHAFVDLERFTGKSQSIIQIARRDFAIRQPAAVQFPRTAKRIFAVSGQAR
jgi:hypothetical protein